MSGIFWHFFTFIAIFLFLAIVTWRLVAIIRQPVHLRWELAPVPHEKGRGKYGGSYLEEPEWWRHPRQHSLIAPIVYMLREIFLMRGVWKNRRSLWPFSYALHAGIYLFVITLSLHLTNAIFIIAAVPAPVRDVFLRIASIVAIAGYISGALGAVGLILIRLLDGNYRPFTTRSMYFRLVFLGAVFISGIGAWCATPLFAMEASWFVNNLVTLDKGIAVAPPLAAHIVISLLFIVYLPLTDMLHFIAKYFTYHSVRWNDAPLNSRMERRLRVLIQRPADWAAPHAGRGKSWAEIAVGKKKNAEET